MTCLMVCLTVGRTWVQGSAGADTSARAGGAQASAAAVVDASDAYQPVPMDRFLYRVLEDPAKGSDEPLTVNQQNELRFSVARGSSESITIPIKGKTIAEIKRELKKILDENYYQNATIYFRLQDQAVRPGLVVIMGSIKRNVTLLPGTQKTVYTVILEAGINDFANLSKVKLWRYNPSTKKEEPTVIDIQSMLKGGSREKDVILQDTDRIEVPEKTIGFGFN